MPEIKSVAVTDSNGRVSGYAYFNAQTGKYYGTGREKISGSRRIGPDGRPVGTSAGRVRRTISNAGARQAARRRRAFRGF